MSDTADLFNLPRGLYARVQALDIQGFSLAVVPKGSVLRRKGEYMVIRGDKLFAYAESVEAAIQLVEDYTQARKKLKGS